jgi:creatinine amidohydrolase
MRLGLAVIGVSVVLAAGAAGRQSPKPAAGGVSLADLSWIEAEPLLTPSTVVVIPLGAGVLEQGPHLKLNSDERLARYLAAKVQAAASVVVAPTLTYHAYPEYVEYPGTSSLTANTAQALTADVVRGFAKHGARRFYVLNTEPSAVPSLLAAAKTLADAGILLGYTDPRFHLRAKAQQIWPRPLPVGHADEITTSMMLFVDPSAVDMTRATREYAQGSGSLTRTAGAPGVFSKSGVLGDATAATRASGQVLVEALVAAALEDIEAVRNAPLPTPRPTAPPPPPRAPGARPPVQVSDDEVMGTGCTGGEDRAIRRLGSLFSAYWKEMDIRALALMFTPQGDMRHPDGTVERTQEVILQNRGELFRKKEYQGSVHTLQLNDIRCPMKDLALADGRWELRLADPPRGAKPYAGWFTLVLRRTGGSGSAWQIEAWRYTVDPPPNTAPAPTILSKPGWPGGPGGD